MDWSDLYPDFYDDEDDPDDPERLTFIFRIATDWKEVDDLVDDG